jgi:hypothetical protein
MLKLASIRPSFFLCQVYYPFPDSTLTLVPYAGMAITSDWLISMGWEYISELRSLMGLLFIPQTIHERAEPR